MWICRSAVAGLVCTHWTWRRDLIGACASRYPSLSCPFARLVRAAPLLGWIGETTMPTMTYPTTASEQTYIEVTGGVDTHKDTHTAAALDASGRLLGHREFAATAAGYAALLAWLGTLGQLVRVGVEPALAPCRRLGINRGGIVTPCLPNGSAN